MLASLTALGLSAAAGLNAYIPLLLVGLLARFTDVVTLPDSAAWIAETWALVVVGSCSPSRPCRRRGRRWRPA